MITAGSVQLVRLGARAFCATLFRARHFAPVGLMIHTEQMQHAMEHQDANLIVERMAYLGSLLAGPIP